MKKTLIVLALFGAFALGGFALFNPSNAPRAEAVSGSTLIGSFPYFLSGSGINSSATSIVLTSLTFPQTARLITTADLSSPFYMTLEPGSTSRQEFISCTTITQNSNKTATLSGCVRGLEPFSPYSTDTAYQFSHSGGTTLIFSNSPSFYQQFANINNAETINGTWTFNAFPVTPSTPAATVSVAGFTTIGTSLQAASSTANGGGPSGTTYVLPTSMATDTPTIGCAAGFTGVKGAGCLLIGDLLGALDPFKLNVSASTTLTASTSIGNFMANDIGKHETYFTATTTWAVPAGVRTVYVRIIGPGGEGLPAASNCIPGSGAGGYVEGMVDVSATSSVNIEVSGQWSRFANPLMVANGGTKAVASASTGGCIGGAGGTAATSTNTTASLAPGSFTASGGRGHAAYYDGTHAGISDGGQTAFGGTSYGWGGDAFSAGTRGNGVVIVSW